MQIPFKTRIVEYLIDKGDAATPKEIYQALKPEYPERYCSAEKIDGILLDLMGAGITKPENVRYDDKDELEVSYKTTELGNSYKSEIPVHD